MIVKFIVGSMVKCIKKTPEHYHLLETLTGDWYFSYNHKAGLYTISAGK